MAMFLDDLLDTFTLKDLFMPLLAFLQDLVNGPHVILAVSALAGISKRRVEQILARGGVSAWGVMYHGDEILFTVRESQNQLAREVLDREGVPITRG